MKTGLDTGFRGIRKFYRWGSRSEEATAVDPAPNCVLENIEVDEIAVNAKHNVYIADSTDGVIRMITPQGIISTFAGGPNTKGFYTNGPAVGAQIRPLGVADGANGTLYFTDGGYLFRVSGGLLSPVATVPDNGLVAITVSNQGSLYVTDVQSLSVLLLSEGGTVVRTVASSATAGNIGNGGPALSAYLDNPAAIAFDKIGGYYIADPAGEVVRYVNSQGIINTVAGTGKAGYSGDGGPANQAQLSNPTSVAVDSAGNLYIADSVNVRIRKVSQGIISTYLGGAGGQFTDSAPMASAVIGLPRGLAFSPAGELYFGDASYARVRRITGGNVVTYAGNGGFAFPSNGGATSQPIGAPQMLAFAPSGDLYVLSMLGNSPLRRFSRSHPTVR